MPEGVNQDLRGPLQLRFCQPYEFDDLHVPWWRAAKALSKCTSMSSSIGT